MASLGRLDMWEGPSAQSLDSTKTNSEARGREGARAESQGSRTVSASQVTHAERVTPPSHDEEDDQRAQGWWWLSAAIGGAGGPGEDPRV